MIDWLFPSSFEWWHLLLLFVACLVGESFGALVGGGSIVTIPALLMTGLPLSAAIAIDNAGSLGTEAGIFVEARKKVLANKKLWLLMAIPITLGGILGTWLLVRIDTDIIKYTMVVVIVVLLVYSHLGKRPAPTKRKLNYAILVVFLLIIGIYANFIAAGEGVFSRMGIMAIVGLSFVQSTAIKATATMPARIYSLVVTAMAGMIVWPYLVTMWVASFIAGRYAIRFASRLSERFIKWFLTAVSIVFVLYLLFFY